MVLLTVRPLEDATIEYMSGICCDCADSRPSGASQKPMTYSQMSQSLLKGDKRLAFRSHLKLGTQRAVRHLPVPLVLLALLLPPFAKMQAQPPAAAGVSEHRKNSTHSHTMSDAAVGGDSVRTITINNNHKSGGRLTGQEFALNLEARMGTWYPDGSDGGGLSVAAFGEVGKALQVPGPLIRVPLGTVVRVTVRNKLGKTLTMFGLDSIRGTSADSSRVEANDTHSFQFVASTPGTFYYAGKTTRAPLLGRHLEDSQLNGVIIVDSTTTTPRANDQAFLISWWYVSDSASQTGLSRATMVINGRSWPHTESLEVAQGDSLHWRWINLTLLNHPMHLHGFYFRVDGKGSDKAFQSFAGNDRREVVTEMLAPGATMALAWSPNRPGNWIFHCHMAAHMSHHMSIGTLMGLPASGNNHKHDDLPASTINTNPDLFVTQSTLDLPQSAELTHSMAGLVLGIRVKPVAAKPRVNKSVSRVEPSGSVRRLHLFIRSKPNVFGDSPGYSYALDENAKDDSTAVGRPGPTLVLQQNQPVAITIVNRSMDGAAVHWHGIELESFPDGVPGWSGSGKSVLPAIAPGDSFTVRFTPPRAGTFMYHSHFNELQQIASGLYGAIIVLPKGAVYDSTTDRVMMFSDDGPTRNFLFGPFPAARLNGLSRPPLEFRAGVTYRLRFINIRTDYIMGIKLSGGVSPVRWRIVAKDGRDLPESQIKEEDAQLKFAPGEIYDVEFTPRAAGLLTFEHRMAELPPPMQAPTYLEVRVR